MTSLMGTSALIVVQLGAGDDTFEWDPGDGSDMVEGQAGSDLLAFNGSNIGERIELSANGSRVRLTRDVAAISMDFAGIERAVVRTFGGADTLTVDDLAGTDLKTVDADLSAFDGTGDNTADTVIVNGTDEARRRRREQLGPPGAGRRAGCADADRGQRACPRHAARPDARWQSTSSRSHRASAI